MQVVNLLIDESFAYTKKKESMAVRRDEIGELMNITAFC